MRDGRGFNLAVSLCVLNQPMAIEVEIDGQLNRVHALPVQVTDTPSAL